MTKGFKETEIGLIPDDWDLKTVTDVANINESSIKKNSKLGLIKYIDIASVDKGIINDMQIISLSEAPTRAKRIVKDDDILISTVRPNLKHYAFVNKAKSNTVASTGFAVISAKKINPKFLYYYLTTDKYTEYLTAIAESHTSAYPSFNPDIIEKSFVPYPSKDEQYLISKVLSDLDNKIELNNEMNRTLEALGQAIFRHWFIDFMFPDENGQPYKSTGGEMIDSELGKIPNGWKVTKLSDICSKVIDGTHDSPSPDYEGYYLVTGRHIINGFIDFSKCYKISPEEHQKVMMRSKPEKGDTIFSNIGTLGTATFVDQDFEFSIKNVALFKPLKPIYSSFIYLYFLYPKTVKKMVNSSSGTTQRFFSLKFLRSWELIKPSDEILLEFNNFLHPILEMRTSLNAQNKNLSQIRDSLLPKLMSGKIRIPLEDEK
jgi:type I restriction enzyme S subunit